MTFRENDVALIKSCNKSEIWCKFRINPFGIRIRKKSYIQFNMLKTLSFFNNDTGKLLKNYKKKFSNNKKKKYLFRVLKKIDFISQYIRIVL